MPVQANPLSKITKKLEALQEKAVKLNAEMVELTKLIKAEEKKISVPPKKFIAKKPVAKKVTAKKPTVKKSPVKKVEVKTPVEAPSVY